MFLCVGSVWERSLSKESNLPKCFHHGAVSVFQEEGLTEKEILDEKYSITAFSFNSYNLCQLFEY